MIKNIGNKKAVIYYRVSTSDQAERGFSLNNQKEVCRKFAESNNFKIVKYFSDAGESAKTTDRPGLQDMLKFCASKKNNINCIVVYKIDRLTRNAEDYYQIKSFFKGLDVQILSATEPVDETSSGRLMGNMMASIAQFDNDIKSERVKEGMIRCAESGRFPHRVTLGYLNFTKPNGEKTIILDPERSELVKYLLNEFSTGIWTEEELRKQVTARGLKTPLGGEITAQLMHKFLSSKFYMGVIEYAGKEFRGTHEALISEETFYKNQKLLRHYTKGQYIANARHDAEFPLRNMIICSYCGRPLTAMYSVGKLGVRYPYYRCYYKQCAYKKSVPKAKLEEEFAKFLEDITPKKDLLNAFKEVILDVWQGKYSDLNQHYATLRTEIDELKLEKAKVFSLVKTGLISDEDFKTEFEAVKMKIADKESQLRETRLEEFDIDEAVTFVFNFIEQLPNYWRQATFWQKTKLMGLIFPEKPVYNYLTFTTPKISHIFQSKTTLSGGKKSMVAHGGIEPPLPG